MKTCPQCNQTYTDDLSFCLSDGSPLSNPSEVATVVKPRVTPIPTSASTPARSSRTSIVIVLLAALLALSLGITAAVLYFFWPRSSNNGNQAAVTNSNRPAETPTATPQPSPTATPAPTRSPKPTETPEPPDDDLPTGSDPGPTRITFAAGRASATVNGQVSRQRTYLLYASQGQSLNARINSPDECAAFSNGSRSISFSTTAGNNSLTVINECDDAAASFSLNVSIR